MKEMIQAFLDIPDLSFLSGFDEKYWLDIINGILDAPDTENVTISINNQNIQFDAEQINLVRDYQLKASTAIFSLSPIISKYNTEWQKIYPSTPITTDELINLILLSLPKDVDFKKLHEKVYLSTFLDQTSEMGCIVVIFCTALQGAMLQDAISTKEDLKIISKVQDFLDRLNPTEKENRLKLEKLTFLCAEFHEKLNKDTSDYPLQKLFFNDLAETASANNKSNLQKIEETEHKLLAFQEHPLWKDSQTLPFIKTLLNEIHDTYLDRVQQYWEYGYETTVSSLTQHFNSLSLLWQSSSLQTTTPSTTAENAPNPSTVKNNS